MKEKILVVFGSKSDKDICHSIIKLLKEESINFDLHICSAHRTPKRIDSILKGEYKIIIAGAGLAAHLPGVIASKTLSPVIGVPCKGAFDGLDSFLSIVQMPSGIPVLCVGVENSEVAANSAILIMKRNFSKINLIYTKQNSSIKKCKTILETFNISFLENKNKEKNLINIEFIEFGRGIKNDKDKLTIYCPFSDASSAEDALKFLKQSESGLFVGLNRGENAAIAAMEILGLKEKISHYRKTLADKVIEDDIEEQKCSHET